MNDNRLEKGGDKKRRNNNMVVEKLAHFISFIFHLEIMINSNKKWKKYILVHICIKNIKILKKYNLINI